MAEKTKKDKKKISFGKAVKNTVFSFRIIRSAAPWLILLTCILSVVQASVNFIGDSYLLRYIINSYTEGRDTYAILTFVIVMAVILLVEGVAENALWNFWRYKKYMAVTAYIQRTLFRKSQEVELSCYEDYSGSVVKTKTLLNISEPDIAIFLDCEPEAILPVFVLSHRRRRRGRLRLASLTERLEAATIVSRRLLNLLHIFESLTVGTFFQRLHAGLSRMADGCSVSMAYSCAG